MKLTRDCKALLDTLITLEPNNGIRFYTADYVLNSMPNAPSPEKFLALLDTLAETKAITWGDSQHTVFSLTEAGWEYKQIDRLETVERWKERAFGFATGVVIALLPQIIS